jgi:hypothetical protein
MNMNRKTALGLVVAGVLVAAGIAVAAPALAGNGSDPGWGDPDDAGWMGRGRMMEQSGPMMERPGQGPGDGTCWVATDGPMGELTDDQPATLAAIAEQHKLAHDLYAAFAQQYQERIFDRTAAAETRQLDALRTLLERYGVTDPTEGLADGVFADPQVQATYDRLLGDGSAGLEAALATGQTLEEEQITTLEEALDDQLTAPDVITVYRHLLMASQHQLAAFDS